MNKNNKINEKIFLDEKKKKPILIWSNSQFNKKTYENIFYKAKIKNLIITYYLNFKLLILII